MRLGKLHCTQIPATNETIGQDADYKTKQLTNPDFLDWGFFLRTIAALIILTEQKTLLERCDSDTTGIDQAISDVQKILETLSHRFETDFGHLSDRAMTFDKSDTPSKALTITHKF
jgi:hypothetical protein